MPNDKSRANRETANLSKWAQAWQKGRLPNFWAYQETIAKIRICCRLHAETQTLLEAFVLEKALYELQYELNNRPTWVHIPLAGILIVVQDDRHRWLQPAVVRLPFRFGHAHF